MVGVSKPTLKNGTTTILASYGVDNAPTFLNFDQNIDVVYGKLASDTSPGIGTPVVPLPGGAGSVSFEIVPSWSMLGVPPIGKGQAVRVTVTNPPIGSYPITVRALAPGGVLSEPITITLSCFEAHTSAVFEAFPVTGSRIIPAAAPGRNGASWVVFSFLSPSLTIGSTTLTGSSTTETVAIVQFDVNGSVVNHATITGLNTTGASFQPAVGKDGSGGLFFVIGPDCLVPTDAAVLTDGNGATRTLSTDPAIFHFTNIAACDWVTTIPSAWGATNVPAIDGDRDTGIVVLEGIDPAPQIRIASIDLATGALTTIDASAPRGTPQELFGGWETSTGPGPSNFRPYTDSSLRYIYLKSLLVAGDEFFVCLDIGVAGRTDISYSDSVVMGLTGGDDLNDGYVLPPGTSLPPGSIYSRYGTIITATTEVPSRGPWVYGSRIFRYGKVGGLGTPWALTGEVNPIAGVPYDAGHAMSFDTSNRILWVQSSGVRPGTAVTVGGSDGGPTAVVIHNPNSTNLNDTVDVLAWYPDDWFGAKKPQGLVELVNGEHASPVTGSSLIGGVDPVAFGIEVGGVSPPKIGGIDASGYRSAFFERYNKASQVINVGGISGPISSVLTASTLPTHGGIAIGTATPGSGTPGTIQVWSTTGNTSGSVNLPAAPSAIWLASFDDLMDFGAVPDANAGNPTGVPDPPTSPDWPSTVQEATADVPTSFIATVKGKDSTNINITPVLALEPGAHVETIDPTSPLIIPPGAYLTVGSTVPIDSISLDACRFGTNPMRQTLINTELSPAQGSFTEITDTTALSNMGLAVAYVVAVDPSLVGLNVDLRVSKGGSGFAESGGHPGVFGWFSTNNSPSSPQATTLEVIDGGGNVHVGHPGSPITISDGYLGSYTIEVAQPTDISGNTDPFLAQVSVAPATRWMGTLRAHLRWNVEGRESNTAEFTTQVTPIYKPDTPTGTMPIVNELETAVGTFTSVDPDSTSFNWWLADTALSSYDATQMFQSKTITDATTGATKGTLSVSGSGRSAQVTFAPAGTWYGTHDAYLAVQDSGGGFSGWATVHIEVKKVNHAPSSPYVVGSLTIPEDTLSTVEIAWSDIDFDPTNPSGSWELQLSQDGQTWLPANSSKDPNFSTNAGGDLTFDVIAPVGLRNPENPVAVSLIVSATDDSNPLARKVQIVPRQAPAHYLGAFSFWARVADTSGKPTLYSSLPTRFVGTVTPVAHAPSMPYPNQMPVTKPGAPITQRFTTADPDSGATVTFQISANGSTGWGTSISGEAGALALTPGGRFSANVTYTPADGFAGQYVFYIKATDNTGLSSPVCRVYGVVGSGPTSVQIQRVDHSTGEVIALCPISTFTNLQITESLGGSGQIQMTVTADEIRRRAAALGITADELIETAAVELQVAIGAEIIAAGPMTATTYNSASATGDTTAMGLLEYLTHAVVEDAGVIGDGVADPASLYFIDQDQINIFQWLLTAEQAKPGGHIGLAGTVEAASSLSGADAASRTIKFSVGSTLAAAFQTLSSQLLGCEYWIDPASRTLNLAKHEGTNRLDKVVFTEKNSTSIQETSKWDDLATVVRAEGTGTMSPTDPRTVFGVASDADGLAKYGRHVHPIQATSLTDAGALEALAAQYVADLRQPLITVDLTYDANPRRPLAQVNTVRVGDFVTVEVDTLMGAKRYPCRVVNRVISIADGTSDQFQVQFQLEKVQLDSDGNPVAPEARTTHNPQLLNLIFDALFKGK